MVKLTLTPQSVSVQSPSTPRKVRKSANDKSPPPPPRLTTLSKALMLRNIDEVRALLDDDPSLTVATIKSCGRIEPPFFFAVRARCPMNILQLLLDKGASHLQPNVNALILLTALQIPSTREMPVLPVIPTRGIAMEAADCQLLSCCSSIMSPTLSLFDDSKQLQKPHQHREFEGQCSDSCRAAEVYELSVAAFLLRYGALPFEKDSHGLCAIDHALRDGKSKLANLMQNWAHWEECLLHYRMGTVWFTDNVIRLVYEFLLPIEILSQRPRSDVVRTQFVRLQC